MTAPFRTLSDLFRAFDPQGPGLFNDPGASGTITFDNWGQVCSVVTATAEARTLARPTKPGIVASVVLDTDGGDLTLTVTGGYNADGDTSITFADAGDMVVFMSVKTGTTYQWTAIAQEGTNIAVETGEFDSLIAGSIAGGDNSLGITGQVQATTVDGGAVLITGAASIAGATGAGGAVTVAGGQAGSTNGEGGLVSLTGGLGKGTENGGAATVAGGQAGVTGDGGAVTLRAGFTGAGATGTGGAISVAGGANNNTTNGAGGVASVTGGAGKGTGVGGNASVSGGAAAGSVAGGNVVLTGGTSGSGNAGGVILRGDTFFAQDAATAETDADNAIAAADFVNGIVVHTVTQARNLTTPTGAQITAVLPAGVTDGDAFYLHVITIGAGADDISTLTGGDGDVTFVGSVAVGPDLAGTGVNYGTWLFRITSLAADTYVGYRIG